MMRVFHKKGASRAIPSVETSAQLRKDVPKQRLHHESESAMMDSNSLFESSVVAASALGGLEYSVS
jgi:hypothetical protein